MSHTLTGGAIVQQDGATGSLVDGSDGCLRRRMYWSGFREHRGCGFCPRATQLNLSWILSKEEPPGVRVGGVARAWKVGLLEPMLELVDRP